MYCRQCGFNNDKYSKMCKRCGSDLTRAVEAYNPEPSEPGKLRFAPKKESVADIFKRRFKRLERAALNKNHRKALIIIAVSVVLAAAALIAVPKIRACSNQVPDTYGTTTGNVATGNAVAENEEFIFCSQPVGDNPGLYRIKRSNGEMLKLSWKPMSNMCWYDGWLYGVDSEGVFVRVSSDGLTEQQVLLEDNLRSASFFNGKVYYIDPYGDILCASLSEVNDSNVAAPYLVASVGACEMMIFEGMIYYIQQTGTCYEPGLPMDNVLDMDYEPGKISLITGKEIPPDYWIEAADADKPVGHIYRMLPDGTAAELIVDEEVCNLSAHGDFLYYMTQTVRQAAATEFDANAPGKIDIRASSCQFWRFNLVTMKYTRFLDEGISRTPLNVTDQSIYYVSIEGHLKTCPAAGGKGVLVPTEAQNVESFSIYGNRVYFTADDGTLVGWINMGEKMSTTLWKAEWDPVVLPEYTSPSDVSNSDAA